MKLDLGVNSRLLIVDVALCLRFANAWYVPGVGKLFVLYGGPQMQCMKQFVVFFV